MANIFEKIYDYLKEKGKGSLSSGSNSAGPYTSSAGSSNQNRNTSTYSGAQRQTVKAYNQPYTSSLKNNSSVIRNSATKQKSYSQPFISDSSNNSYSGNSPKANITLKQVNDAGAEIRNSIVKGAAAFSNIMGSFNKARREAGMSTPIQGVVEKTTPIIQGAQKKVTGVLKDYQQEQLDDRFAELTSVSPVTEKIKSDQTYAQKLMDQDGNLIDYTDQIEQVKQQMANPATRSEELKAQLDELENIQADQNRLLYTSYYNQLNEKGATQEELNQFKNYVIAEDYNGLERLLATVGGSLENYAGSMAKSYESLYAAASNLLGVDYDANDPNSIGNYVIDNSEQLLQNARQGATGIERTIQEIYTSEANYLYSVALAMATKGASFADMSSSETVSKAISDKALLYSDMSIFGSTVKNRMNEGYDFWTSLESAGFAAALADTTERIGGETFFEIFSTQAGQEMTKNLIGYTMKHLAKSFGSEAIEEGTEATIDPLLDSIILKGRGMTMKEYFDSLDAKDIGYQMLIGGLGGMLGGGAGLVGLTIDTKKDVNQMQSIKETYHQMMNSSAFNSNDKAYIRTQIDQINQMISDYETRNPYAKAFTSASDSDVINTSLQENEETMLKFAQTDLTAKLEPIVELKEQMLQKTDEFYAQGRERLAAENIDMDIVDYESLSPEAKVNTSITAKYAQSLGRKVSFANLVDADGDIVDGVYINGRTVINPNAKQGALSTMLHEYTHGMEASKYYSALRESVEEYMGDNYETAIGVIKRKYSTIQNLSDSEAEKELVAIASQGLLENMQFVDRMVKYSNSLATRIYEDVKHLLGFSDAVGSIEHNFMKAFKDAEDNRVSLEDGISYSKGLEFGDLVKLIEKGSYNDSSNALEVRGTSPDWMVLAGYEQLPMLMTVNHVKSGLGIGRSGNQHNVSARVISALPRLLDDPIAVYQSHNNSIVAILRATDKNGKAIIVSIKPSGTGYYNNVSIDTNFVTSMYGKDRFIRYFNNVLSKNKQIYPFGKTKKQIVQEILGLQLSNDYLPSAISSISDMDPKVKKEITKLSKGLKLEDLGRRKDLLAVHNLNEKNLLKSLDLGGFAMPSIAISKDSMSHEDYGKISLVFDKSTIDPKSSKNKVYGGDAWTVTYPSVDYDVDSKELRNVYRALEQMNGFDRKMLRDLDNDLYKIEDPDALSKAIRDTNGDIAEAFKDSNSLKYLYMNNNGQEISMPMREVNLSTRTDNDGLRYIINKLGAETIKDGWSNRPEGFAKEVTDALAEYNTQKFGDSLINERDIDPNTQGLYFASLDNLCYKMIQLINDPNAAMRVENNARFEVENQEDYMNWLRNLFKDVEVQSGIYNGKDYLTNNGRRSFKQLHYDYNLDNILKYMLKESKDEARGVQGGVFGGSTFGSIAATQKKVFSSINDIIANEDMIQDVNSEEATASYDALKERTQQVISEIIDSQESKRDPYFDYFGDASDAIQEIIQRSNKEAMLSYAKKEFGYMKISDDNWSKIVDDIYELKEPLSKMATKYFEAKPRRIVTPNEIQTAVIPNDSSEVLKQRLSSLGINTIEYDPKIEGDRSNKINNLDNLKFSKGVSFDELNSVARKELRDAFQDKTRRVSLKQEIQNIIDDIRNNGEISTDSYDALREKVIESSYSKIPNPAYEVAQGIREIMGGNFLRKDGWDKTLAEINDKYHILDEDNSIVGNSYLDAKNFIRDYIQSLGEKYLYMNPVDMGDLTEEEFDQIVSRKLNETIEYLRDSIENETLDEYGTTADVANILNADESRLIDRLVYEDATGDSNAVSQTLNGIKYDMETGEIIEDLYKLSTESLEALIKEDPDGTIQKMAEEAAVGNYAPEALDLMEKEVLKGLTIENAKEQVPEVLKDVEKKKPLRSMKDILYQVRQKIFDKGIAIRDMKDRKLSDSYDYLLSSENMANKAILDGIYDQNGKKLSDSLVSISKLIPANEKNDFDYYMYHAHNVDAAKIGKDVFFGFPSIKSQEIVNQYELLHPEWKNIAQKYYDFNDVLLQRQVDSGVISQETANRWKEMYPHYVPTKRAMEKVDERSVLETADPKVTSSNKGTLYERTGGSSPIQPLDYAMAEHTKQIYKSSLFNKFAKEYVRASRSPTNLFNEDRSFDENIIQGEEAVVQEADEYTPATLIWYEQGDRHIVEIPAHIYDALGPTQTPFDLPANVPFVAWATKLRTNMITGANPVFWLTNGFKDFQDIGFNSKYARDTYFNLPRAYKELITNGQMARIYKANGGEYQTYSSEAGVNQNDHGKFYNATIGNFVKFNQLVEMAPRLAEFMSSLDHGDSIEAAMYNAAEVTTNFKRGGDYAKWLNRNGFNFLNASIQGFDKQIRNIEDAYDSRGWKGIVSYMTKATLLSGIPLVILNGLLHKDDEDYDKLSDYIKDNYYILWKYDDGKFVRIPKGRIANAYQGIMTGLYENGVELASDDSAAKKAKKVWENTLDSLLNVWEQIGINDVGGNNILSPVMQMVKNEAWYGDPIVSTYMQKKDPADQYDESTDLISIWLGEKLNYSPKKINYLIDQYSGGAGDAILPMLTQKAETRLDDGTLRGKATSALLSPVVDKFTTDSVFKNQDVTDFFTLDEELTAMAQKEHASDESILASKYINSIQKQMNDLYAERRSIYKDDSLTDAQKYDKAREVQRKIDDLAKLGLDTYDQIDMGSYYGSVNGISYYKNGNDEWTKSEQDKESDLDALGLNADQKSDYYYTKNAIANIRKDIKADTPEGETADYKAATINAIRNSGLDAKSQNYLYDSYYSGALAERINEMNLSDEEKLALKFANANATAVKDENGKTVSNSKALSVADAYADAGLLDDVYEYIKKNDLKPSDFGLTKTVYGYSYEKLAAAYKKVFGQDFGTGETVQLENTSYNSSGRSSNGSSGSSSGTTSKKEQQQIVKLKKALINVLKKINANNTISGKKVDYSNVLKGVTDMSDAKNQVAKIMANINKM
ncbi:MAG: hypothetical protein IJK53_08145 [Erysipelotrichaceae bacterium]|nr:hypothetical protein [Erysipelotrichaceae bacterium]